MWSEIKTSKAVAVCSVGGMVIGYLMFEPVSAVSVLGSGAAAGALAFVGLGHLKDKEKQERERIAREEFRKRVEASKQKAKETAKSVVKEITDVPKQVGEEAVQTGKDAAVVGAKIGGAVIGSAVGLVSGAAGKVVDLFKRIKKDKVEEPENEKPAPKDLN
jgi:hypothetical protein